MESEAREGDEASVQTEKETEGGGEWGTLRLRRNEEIREELAAVEKMEKVKGSRRTMLANKLERTQLQKLRGIPLLASHKRQPIRRRRFVYKGMWHKVENEKRDEEEEEEGKEKNFSRKRSWVVGQFGDEGVKDLRKGDEEELKDLHRMGVVRKRLTEKEKVREQAVKFFKHRYILDPESTQKSNTILVTGYEPSPDEGCSAVELIRQQSSIVISNFFDQPAYPVLSRLSDSERENLERVVVDAKEGRGGEPMDNDPLTVGGLEFGEARGPKKVRFQRGASLEGIGEEGGGFHDDDDDHVISKAKHVRAKSAPHVTTPLPPPPLSSSSSVMTSPSPPVPMAAAVSATPPDSPRVTFPFQSETEPSPPHVLVRTPSYVSAMETEEVVEHPTTPPKETKPKPMESPKSPRKKTSKSKSPQSPHKKGSPRRERRLFSRRSKKEKKREEEEEKIGSYLALSYDSSSGFDEGAELMRSHDDSWKREDSSSSSLADELALAPSKVPTLEPLAPSQLQQSSKSSKLPPQRPSDPSRPLEPLDPSKYPSADPSRPLKGSQTVEPSKPRPYHHRLTPQFSITSLPGLDPAPRKYYTPISPRVDKVMGTYTGDTNPFAKDFDRALQEQAAAQPRNSAPPVTRSNTQLPDDIMRNEGFLEFLQMNDAKPSTSMYITYQIQQISEQIDSKYGNQLNQALDEIIPEIIANSVSWENFSAACRSLLFKGEGFKDGIFMVPAFAKRLLGFLPGMRDVITEYTQAVLEVYAMDWLLMRGGWGELLRYREHEDRGREEEERAGSSDAMWVWPAEETREWWEESQGEGGGAEDSFHSAMGYGVVTPGPECQGRSLAIPDIPLSDVGCVVDRQVGDHDDRPHPYDEQPTFPAMEMGSQLFLAPVQELAPPIGRGLRRVISVEVLFTTPSNSGNEDTDFLLKRPSLTRVSSLPSLCSSILSPTSPISIPSPRKRTSADISSASPSSPSVFTLPSMKRRTHPLDSSSTSSGSPDYRQQSSGGSSIRLVGGGAGGDLSPTPSSPLVSRTKFNDITTSPKPSGLVSRGAKTDSTNGDNKVSGQNEATPPTPTTPNDTCSKSNEISHTPSSAQHNGGGFHDNHEDTPTHDSSNHENEATPTNNELKPVPVQRSVTGSTEGSYADFGLTESENGRMTEWEWNWTKISAVLLTAAAGIAVTFFVIKKNRQ